MINVRLMLDSDIEQVAAIEKDVFSTPWSEKSFSESLTGGNALFVVAEKDNVIAGYCGMYISYEEGNITNVAVAPQYRRQGIAAKIIDYILKLASEKGITKVFLEVRETNISAISLYEHLGFEKSGIRKNFYQKPVENALIMWKHNL